MMNVKIEKIDKSSWRLLSESMHKSVFSGMQAASEERIDFALIAYRMPEKQVFCYLTCKEMNGETLYCQYGGSFRDSRASLLVTKAFKMMLDLCPSIYKRITMLIENTNKAALKMASHIGFLITGIRYFRGTILLEHSWERAA